MEKPYPKSRAFKPLQTIMDKENELKGGEEMFCWLHNLNRNFMNCLSTT